MEVEKKDKETKSGRREESGRAKESKRQKVIGSVMASSCMAPSQGPTLHDTQTCTHQVASATLTEDLGIF